MRIRTIELLYYHYILRARMRMTENSIACISLGYINLITIRERNEILVATELSVRRIQHLKGALVAPGPLVAAMPILAVLGSFAWIVGTVWGCYVMHASLQDPLVRFPQISELAVGVPAAQLLYRLGFASAAMLLAAVVQLHSELCLPHLPKGDLAESFTYYGLCSAAGVALQGLLLLEPRMTPQTLLHLLGALFFFYGAWCHMSAAERLYLPQLPAEESPEYQEQLLLLEEIAQSELLSLRPVHFLVLLRHKAYHSACDAWPNTMLIHAIRNTCVCRHRFFSSFFL